MMILDGVAVGDAMKEALVPRISALAAKGVVPALAAVLVGEDPSSVTYVRMKRNACKRLGMISRLVELPAETDTATLVSVIEQLNRDSAIHGILLQHPVPGQIDERAAFEAIAPEKDVDGVTSAGFGRAAFGLPCFHSCTPEGIMRILDHYHVPIEGRHAVVVGRSPILGKPVAMLLLNRNATVTVCHSRTEGLAGYVQQADILVAAVGKAHFIKGEWIKPGAVVLDAGYSGNRGDVDYEAAVTRAGAITPVPGGVGPVTIASLLENTVRAAEHLRAQAE
ncbi:MAG TPA: bifunctional 5,10-methylenetetrahydrofolate dehydrogenase/5,10-methenyltetrahydrofolate cyclohydrolase [Symbiobacteriaceae bacterium]|nr:bifunctional 5,10-methylenetetrahydrofolate dehydrogenase/5,10-methenyltetrahydrofolate cyclohydrolase [Symbiobacteriaceae bacterium]